MVDILTLSATGSEFDGGGVITNLKTNEKLGGMYTYPAVSICDPTYTFSVSAYQTAAGSADIMSHIFEGYFSRTEDSALSDGIAETILRTVMKYCPIAIREPDNYEARANLMAVSSVACSGIPMTLSELKIGPEDFAEMASHANAGSYLKNAFVALTDHVPNSRICSALSAIARKCSQFIGQVQEKAYIRTNVKQCQ